MKVKFMRPFAFVALIAILCFASAKAQDGGPQVSNTKNQSKPITMTVQPWKGSGIPDGWKPKSWPSQPHVCAGSQGRPRDGSTSTSFDPDGLIVDHADDASANKASQTNSLGVGRSFVANNMTDGWPTDNSMAISNSGFIVSADNTTIDFYRDTPDTLLQFQYHRDFYGDSLVHDLTFDPHVIYDRYADRFIVVMIFKLGSDSDLLVSFSKTDDPRDGWNHYHVDTDTLDPGQYMDFPQIGINRDELFIAGNMVGDLDLEPSSNKLYQIRKQDGYDSLALNMRIWPDILDPSGDPAFFLCPLSDGLMADSYDRGMYFASTELLTAGQTGTKLFWFHLTDSVGAPGSTIDAMQLGSGQPYSSPLLGFQLGSTDFLDLGNCRVHSGFHLGGTLYFVYSKNTNSYCTIVLNRVDTQTNTLQRNGWGFSSGFQDDSQPSIAFAGVDSADNAKLLMTFQRSGANIFMQMRAVYFDSVFPANSVLVKPGDGYLDLNSTAGASERIGDYTATQRRYGAATPTCWAVASYPVGANGNHFGQVNGLNGFVAEFTDSLANAAPSGLQEDHTIAVFPNPTTGLIHVFSSIPHRQFREISLLDMQGRAAMVWQGNWGQEEVSLDVASQPRGLYILRVQFKSEDYAYIKVVLD